MNVRRLRFLDGRSREEIPALLASADVALVPLRQTLPGAVPSKLYEAMGAGVPIVLIADGEARDVLLETGSGIAVSPGDVAGLREALERLAQDPERRARLGTAGRSAAERSFSRQQIGERFVGHLERALTC
jgi:glycosyltransferase involved in cell wall biosynthesis